MFRTVPLSIVRSFSLYTQKWYMSYRFAGRKLSANLYDIPLLCVQWKSPDDGQRDCPKPVEFYSKNKFEKLVQLVGSFIRIYHDTRSPERQNLANLVNVLDQDCFKTFVGRRWKKNWSKGELTTCSSPELTRIYVQNGKPCSHIRLR